MTDEEKEKTQELGGRGQAQEEEEYRGAHPGAVRWRNRSSRIYRPDPGSCGRRYRPLYLP